MQAVITQSLSFVFIIALGYVLKRLGLFRREQARVFSVVILNVTLPAMILTSDVSFVFDGVYGVVLIVSILANILMALAGRVVFSKRTDQKKGSAIFSCSGYNTGNMAIPFAAPFYPGLGLSYVFMFDIGNAIGWMGAAIGFGKSVAGGKGFDIKTVFFMLFRTVPFLIYIPVLILGAIDYSLPEPVLGVLRPVGNANPFLVMFMIGLLLDFKVSKRELGDVFEILGVRFIGFVVLILIVWFLLPIPVLAKQMCILSAASSMPTATTAFCQQIGDDSSVPPMATSISILIGIVFSSLSLIIFMG